MKQSDTAIPPDAKALAEQGRLIEAIKVTRERTGMGLKEAKDAVDAYTANPQSNSRFNSASARNESVNLPVQAILFLEEGRLIDAIKLTRETLGLRLKVAKETVESYLERNPELYARYKAASATARRQIAQRLVAAAALVGGTVFIVLHFIGKSGK